MAGYVVSDIHGHYDLLLKGLLEIGFTGKDYLYCLGDAIDRGPDGIKVLRHIMDNSENMDLIIGNHELMMLNSIDLSGKIECNGPDSSFWLGANGGYPTYEGYTDLSCEERKRLLEWLSNRYVIRNLRYPDHDYCLTHSYYNPKCMWKRYNELPYAKVWSITWSSMWREDFLTHGLDVYSKYDYTFVCGHVPVQNIRRRHEAEKEWNCLKSFRHNNVIGIDGGCSLEKDGNLHNGLIFLRLDDLKEFAIPL